MRNHDRSACTGNFLRIVLALSIFLQLVPVVPVHHVYAVTSELQQDNPPPTTAESLPSAVLTDTLPLLAPTTIITTLLTASSTPTVVLTETAPLLSATSTITLTLVLTTSATPVTMPVITNTPTVTVSATLTPTVAGQITETDSPQIPITTTEPTGTITTVPEVPTETATTADLPSETPTPMPATPTPDRGTATSMWVATSTPLPMETLVVTVTATTTPTVEVEPTPQPDTTAEISPEGGEILALGGRVIVRFPAGAVDEVIQVRIGRPVQDGLTGPEKVLPPYSLSRSPFELEAIRKRDGSELTQFNQPLEIEVNYAETEIQGDEESLYLFYYDERQETWIPLPTKLDTEQNRLIGTSNHFTVFDIDVQNWQAATLPTVKGFQVSSFTGAATYSYPIQVPPGPGGLQPQLALTYSSQVVDSASNKTQASWVGMGWSMDTGYIERDFYNGTKVTTDDTFVLVLNGSSYRLLPGADGRWHTEDESYLRIQYAGNPNAYADQPKEWTVWDKEGNKYLFGSTNELHRATYPKDAEQWTWRWSLRTVTNIFGQSLSYKYTYEGVSKTGCGTQLETFCDGSCNDVAVYPQEILYPNGKYRIQFDLSSRTDYENGWLDACAGIHFYRSKLSTIRVEHYNGSGWETIRKYTLGYTTGSGVIFPGWIWNAGGKTPTLTSIVEYATDGTTTLPTTSFTYADSMHLTKAQNGYGGSVEFDYKIWYDNNVAEPKIQDQKNNRCEDYYQWVAGANTTKQCSTTTPSGLRFKKSGTATYGTVSENNYFRVFRPGGAYRIHSYFQKWDQAPHEVRAGLDWSGGTAWEGSTYHTIVNGSGSAEDEFDAYMTMPTNASRLWLSYEGNGVLRGFTPYNLVTRYRVSTKRVKDSHTSKTHTFTYTYDEPATNDPVHSAVVAVPTTTAQRYFTEAYSEFRGHAMVKEKGPDGRVTLSWYRQDDIRGGQQVYQQVGEELFADDFEPTGNCDSAYNASTSSWSYPAGSAWLQRNTGDCALTLVNSGHAQRNSYSLQDGNVVLTQFKVLAGTAVLALETNTSRRWGIYVKPDKSVVVQYSDNGTTFSEAALLGVNTFKYDTWYVLMVGTDSGTDLVRLWERDKAPESSSITAYQSSKVSSGLSWRFHAWSGSGGTLLVDSYNELRLFSEVETKIDSSPIALQSGWSLSTLVSNQSKTLIGLNGYWTRTANEKSLLFNNDTKWVGKQIEYFYETTEQNGSQYGNLTRTIESEWNGASFVRYRSTKRWFYPKDTTSGTLVYLVGLPAAENLYACPSGTCDYGGDDSLTSQWYLYDTQSSYNVAPTTGKLTGGRTWICPANSSNVCVAYGSHTKQLYSDVDYTYDSYGNQATVKVYTNYGDSGTRATTTARTTTFGYDTAGYNTYKVSETNPAGHVTTWVYNYRQSVPTQETDPNSVLTSAEYDSFGRMIKIIRPGDTSSSPTTMISYYDRGVNNVGPFATRLIQKHSGGSYTLFKFYDGLGQPIQTVAYNATVNGSARDIIVDTDYDAYGRVVKQRMPYDTTIWGGGTTTSPFRAQSFSGVPMTVTTYDKVGRVTKVASPTASEDVDYTYGTDLTTVMQNARGNSITTIYDIWGRVKEVRPPSDPWLRYTYNSADQLTKVEKMTGTSSIFGTTTMSPVDALGRKWGMSDMDMGTWSYRYDALGNLTSQIDARPCTTALAYDSLSRLTGKSYSGTCGTTTAAITYGYDATTPTGNKGKGKRTSMSDGSGSTTWEYGDSRGRLTKETKTISSVNYVTQWAYDSADQLTSMTYPDSEIVSYSYLPQMMVNQVGGGTYVQQTLYDAAGRVDLRKLGGDQIRTDYIYNNWNTQGGRLSSLQSGPPSGAGNGVTANLQFLGYSYDLNGNVTALSDALAGGTQQQNFTYDTQDRITAASTSGGSGGPYSQSYTYDSYGRLLNGPQGTGYTYNAGHKHAVATAGGISYGYDANGNMSSRGGYTFNYDAENRLVSVSGAATASFVYDGDNHRVKGTIGGVTSVYIGNYYEVAGSTVKKYYYAGNQRVAMKSGTTLYWLLSDHLGGTAITVSGTTETGEVRYYPFGTDRYTSGTTPTSFKYTGQRQESGIGLYYYGARWYDPALGRFVQPDTLVPNPGDAKSFDRYAYVLNNPLKYADPTGHEPCSTGNWGDCSPGSKASTNPYRGERRRAIVRHGRALADNPQLTSLEKFAQLTEYASQFYGDRGQYTYQDYDNYMQDLSFAITGWDRTSFVGVQAVGLGEVASRDQWLNTNIFRDFSGWRSEYNDYNPPNVTLNNQMYHFWFYAYSSYYDGPMVASVGNWIHETRLPEVHQRIQQQNQGISQQDSDLGTAGVQLGSLLNVSAYVSARGTSPTDPNLGFSMLTPDSIGQWIRYNLGIQTGPQ